MKKYVFTLIAMLLLFSSVAYGVASNRVYYHIEVVNELLERVTSPAITQIDIQNESGTAVAVYSTKFGTTEVGSTGVITTGLADGRTEFWYGDTAIDITVTDGTRTYEIESFSVRDVRFMLPRFLTATAGSTYAQTDDIDFTHGSWIIDGDTANRLDMIPDNDAAILGIGDGTSQADVYIYSSSTVYAFFDEGEAILEMVAYDINLDDSSILRFGTNDDFTVYSDTADTLEFDPASAGNQIKFGTAFGDAVDLTWYGDLTGDTVAFDEENCEVLFTDIDIQLDDDALLIVGTNDDFTIYSDTANILEFDPATAGNEIRFGTAFGDAVDLTWYGDLTGDTVAFDEENCEVLFTDIDIQMDNAADIIMGTTDATGFTIDCDTAKTLDILAGANSDDFVVNLGLDQSGVDLKIFGSTTGEYWSYDASADSVLANTGNYLYSSTDAEANQFKVDAKGTVAGNAIVFETTDGGVQINADGAANGDITVDAADNVAIIAAGDVDFTVTGTLTLGDINYTRRVTVVTASTTTLVPAGTGNVYITTAGTVSSTFNLPTASAGLTFTFVDISATAADDVEIVASSGDKINGGSAAGSFHCVTDAIPQSVTLTAIDATDWVVTSLVGTWSNMN